MPSHKAKNQTTLIRCEPSCPLFFFYARLCSASSLVENKADAVLLLCRSEMIARPPCRKSWLARS